MNTYQEENLEKLYKFAKSGVITPEDYLIRGLFIITGLVNE